VPLGTSTTLFVLFPFASKWKGGVGGKTHTPPKDQLKKKKEQDNPMHTKKHTDHHPLNQNQNQQQ